MCNLRGHWWEPFCGTEAHILYVPLFSRGIWNSVSRMFVNNSCHQAQNSVQCARWQIWQRYCARNPGACRVAAPNRRKYWIKSWGLMSCSYSACRHGDNIISQFYIACQHSTCAGWSRLSAACLFNAASCIGRPSKQAHMQAPTAHRAAATAGRYVQLLQPKRKCQTIAEHNSLNLRALVGAEHLHCQ